MVARKQSGTKLLESVETGPAEEESFSEQMRLELDRLDDSGLSPTSALRLLKSLVIESAAADKTKIEKLKMMDKLLNTARAVMETSVKHEETAIIRERLEQLEARLEQLQKPSR